MVAINVVTISVNYFLAVAAAKKTDTYMFEKAWFEMVSICPTK